MEFLLGLVLGLAAGVALIIAFVQLENFRSKKRAELVMPIIFFGVSCSVGLESYDFLYGVLISWMDV